MTTPTEERFWSKVERRSEQECWPWKAATDKGGYGDFRIHKDGKRKHHSAHRVAFMLHFGEINSRQDVCHKCDNPICVNPSHLFLGTVSDNIRDRNRKDRGNYKAVAEKLSLFIPEQILEIRQKYATRTHSYKQLADEYGVSKSTIAGIVKRITWRHV